METVGAAVIDGAIFIFKLTYSVFKALSKYEEDICELQEEISYLRNKRILITQEVSIAIMEGKTPKHHVNEWLRKVSQAEDVVRPLLQMLHMHDENADGWGTKMLRQYQQSWKVAKKLEQVKELIFTDFETVSSEG